MNKSAFLLSHKQKKKKIKNRWIRNLSTYLTCILKNVKFITYIKL